MKILNLYLGIGGNRKYWNDIKEDIEVTAIEIDEDIAKIYQDFFPNDKVIVSDAHKYLVDNYEKYDFIWSSPPCPTHSTIRKATQHQNKPVYPDMSLYEEVLFLDGYFKGSWVVENVISWYDPLIKPQEIGLHYYWSNRLIPKYNIKSRNHDGSIKSLQKTKGFDLEQYSRIDKRKTLRNCVEPEVGKHIFNYIINPIEHNFKLI